MNLHSSFRAESNIACGRAPERDHELMNGVRPISHYGHSKIGSCGVCGAYGQLTWTHVPPRCAANIQAARPLVTVPGGGGNRVISLGQEKEGGAAAYLLCRGCNEDAGRWYDPEFGALWVHLAKRLLVDGEMPPPGGPYVLSIENVDPGAFVRAVLSGMMGICPTLRTQFPELQSAVQLRKLVRPPNNLFLLLALYPELDCWVAGGGSQRNALGAGRSESPVFAFAEYAWSPLYLVLVDRSGCEYWTGATDILSWMMDRPGARRRIDLLVPVLTRDQLHSAEVHRGVRRLPVPGPNGEITVWSG